MDQIALQVRRAQRRLSLQRFVYALAWCWFGTLLAAAVLIGVEKYWPLGLNAWAWLCGLFGYQPAPWLTVQTFQWIWPSMALALGLAIALMWTRLTRGDSIEAAIELDRRFGLKERVSSSLSLTPLELDSEAGRALLADAVRRVEQVQVSDRFGIRLGRWSWLPLIPAAVAFLLAVFLPEAATQQASATQDTAEIQKQIKKSSEALRRKLVDRRKEAREKGLKDAEDLFEKLEREMKEQARADQADRKQSLVKLNNLAQDLEKRRQELGNNDKLRQQLNQLKPSAQGPADKLGQALRDGDMKQAMKEIDKLKQQLNEGKLDDQGQKDLAKQLGEMQQKLKHMADAHRQAKEDLQKQIREKKAAGQTAEAEKLQQQLDKLAQQDQQMQKAEEMAQKMGQCAQCMKQGQMREAGEALDKMQGDLEAMQAQLEEMQMLEEALDEIGECKDGMLEGEGKGKGKGDRNGDGRGEGRGRGDRPEQATDTKFYDSKVKQKIKGGSAVVTGYVEGPNVRGQIEQEIKTQIESAKTESADPLTGQRLPREYRDHARGYFDLLRDGVPDDAQPAGGE
jgi:hypothetical protein